MERKQSQNERIEVFKDTRKLYSENEKLSTVVKASKEKQKVILEADDISDSDTGKKYEVPAKVIVSKKRSLATSKI